MSSFAPIGMTPAPPGWLVDIEGSTDSKDRVACPVIGWAIVRNFTDPRERNDVFPVHVWEGFLWAEMAREQSMHVYFDPEAYELALQAGRDARNAE